MKNWVSFAVTVLVLSAGSGASGAPKRKIDLGYNRVLNLGQVRDTQIAVWIPYPALNGKNCTLDLRMSDQVDLSKGEQPILDLINSLEVKNRFDNNPNATVPIDNLSIDLKPFSGAFGVILDVSSKNGKPIQDAVHAALGKGGQLGLPVDVVLDVNDCEKP
jgi:hypothetical protein